MNRRITVRTFAVLVLVLIVVATSACTASFTTAVTMDRNGRGEVTVTLTLDESALRALGLPRDDSQAIASRFVPLLDDGGWAAPDGEETTAEGGLVSVSRDNEGTVTLRSRKAFENVGELSAIISRRRELRRVPGAFGAAQYAALPDLPETAAVINDFTFRLGDGTGDNPGFYFFGRGGVGNLGQATCMGGRVDGMARTLRDALTMEYRLKVPGGPGSTNATRIANGESVWAARYGDCPGMQADSGGGSSSTLVNMLILAGISGFLIIVFVVRGVRRRGENSRQVGNHAVDR